MAIKIAGTEVINDDKRVLNNESLPDVRPSLLLDFANSKTLDPRITFTRGSTATYWDGKTTAKAEENLITYSQDIVAGNWNITQLGVVDDQTAPDGTSTAQLFTPNTNHNYHYVYTGNSPVTTAPNTFSVYAKNNGANYAFLRSNTSGGYCGVNFDLSNSGSAAVEGSGNIDSYSATDVGNGWYRLTVTFNVTLASQTQLLINGNNTNVADTYNGNGTDGIYFWGAQLENRSSATAYTATTTSPIVKYQPTLQTAASGEARFDHDPVTGESKGLLIEEARTNLFTYSIDFSNWSTGATVITDDTAIAPDGTLTAATLLENATNLTETQHTLRLSPAVSATVYTISAFFKETDRNSRRYVALTMHGMGYVAFDIQEGVIAQSYGSNIVSSNIEDAGNGWYRCSATYDKSGSTTAGSFIILHDGTNGGHVYAADGTQKGMHVWGAQLEEGSFPTSYIPTSGSTVTRAKDDAVMSGSNFTDWYTGPPLSVYGEYTLLAEGSPSQRLFSLDDGGYANRLLGVVSASNGYGPYMEVFHNNVNTFTGSVATGVANTPSSLQKLVGAFDTDDFATSRNGGTVGVDTSGTIPPTLNQLRIGSMANAALHMSGAIKKLAFYPKRLPNATLQAMTEA